MRYSGHILLTLSLAMTMAVLTACRDGELPRGPHGGELRITVSTGDFSPTGSTTRTTETGYSTNFAVGDRIGITVIKDGETIIENNVPYRFDGAAWRPEDSTNAVHRYPGAIEYLVYYPYAAAMDGKKTTTEITDAFIPPTDQSTATAYCASDLMTGVALMSGTSLVVTITHALSLVEVNLPTGATSATLKINGGEAYSLYNISGKSFRCIMKPVEAASMEGTYTIIGTTMTWRKADVALVAGKYTRITAINSFYVGEIVIAYTDGSSETVIYDHLTGNIPLIHSAGTVESITLPGADGKTHLIGRKADADLTLKIHGSGEMRFRAANGEDYIPIGSYAEFQLIGTIPDALEKNYRLEADLDLMNREWTPIGEDAVYPRSFTGTFDGGGRVITNLKIERPEGEFVGLFAAFSDGRIEGIHIASGTVKGKDNVGALCGYVFSGSITACSNAAAVEGETEVGGLVGGNHDGDISACRNTGAVSGTTAVGGIAGENDGNIIACYNTAAVSAADYVGGIVGQNGSSGKIMACYNSGMTTSPTNVGSLVAANIGKVTACYWLTGTALVGINDIPDPEDAEIVGTSEAINSYTEPPGFVPDAATYPEWSVRTGGWKNYTGGGGAPQLYWE